jgi:hypothetical protein
MARMYPQLEKMETAENVFEGSSNKLDTTDLEANPEKSDAVAEHQEAPKEETAVETIEVFIDQNGDHHLAVRHRRQPKKRTQGDGGSRNNLTAAGHRGPTVEKRRWKGPECNNGIRNRGLKQKLRLGNKKTLSKENAKETLRQTIQLKVVKLGSGSSMRIRKMSVKTS